MKVPDSKAVTSEEIPERSPADRLASLSSMLPTVRGSVGFS